MTVARALLLATLLVAAACKGEARRPPTSAPEAEVPAAAWAAVEAAGAPAIAPGPADPLVRALALIAASKLPDGLRAGFDPHDQALRAQLSTDVLDAVDALVQWDQVEGRLPARPCSVGLAGGAAGGAAPLKVAAALNLGRAALVVASGDPDAPELHAVLRLAQRFRVEGRSVLEGMVGSAFAGMAREWAVALGLPAAGALRGYTPTEDGLLRLVAAEATCSLELYGSVGTPEHQQERDLIARLHHATTAAEVDHAIAAEDDRLRRFWLELLAAEQGRAADPAATDRKLEARADELRRAPAREPFLSVIAPAAIVAIGRLRAADDQQRAWLAGTPSPP